MERERERDGEEGERGMEREGGGGVRGKLRWRYMCMSNVGMLCHCLFGS